MKTRPPIFSLILIAAAPLAQAFRELQVIALVLIVALLNLWRDTPGFARGATVANLALVAAGLLLTGYQLTRYVAT